MPERHSRFSLRSFLRQIGPGIITGAADDDPSGIATSAQAGAAMGTGLLWIALFVTPLMISVQEMCARIGLVTGKGLTGVLRKYYPKPLLALLAILVVLANTMNIGADIAGMAAATQLILPVPAWMLSLAYSACILFFIIFASYQRFARTMKWLVLALLLYIIVPFTMKIDWAAVLRATVIPSFELNKNSIMLIVGLLGTIISPYLFFWQTSLEVEDKKNRLQTFKRWIVTKNEMKLMREDVTLGMIFSNTVTWFIILTTAVTLFPNGIMNITTAQQAAEALRPIAGNAAYIMFTLGIVGTGFLAIPVLAGSSSYVLAEAFGWKTGINQPFHEAKKFYVVIICSTLVGIFMSSLGINPIQALLYTAVIYGVISPPLIAIILHIANNKKIMGKHVNSLLSNTLGILTFIVMTTAAILFLFLSMR